MGFLLGCLIAVTLAGAIALGRLAWCQEEERMANAVTAAVFLVMGIGALAASTL